MRPRNQRKEMHGRPLCRDDLLCRLVPRDLNGKPVLLRMENLLPFCGKPVFQLVLADQQPLLQG